ncbi:MAG: DUF4382 domain-containing protein [Dehalococcoidia bacterium]|jgi:hypothetical protein
MKKILFILATLIVLSLTMTTAACNESEQATAPNFALLISDEANAITDFDHLYINISSIGMHLSDGTGNESGEWLEFTPDITQVDLRPLLDDNAMTIWSGNITEGQYTKVFIYVDDAWGVLTGDNESDTVEVDIPSNKLQISRPFTVNNSSTTAFVYDITVISTGNEHSGIDYQLSPQIAKSGADQPYIEVETED